MRFHTSIMAIAFASGAVFASSAALAQEPENTVGCLHLSKQVSQALDSNQQSPNLRAAQDEQSAGREYCNSGVYRLGVAHYEKALSYLGQGKS